MKNFHFVYGAFLICASTILFPLNSVVATEVEQPSQTDKSSLNTQQQPSTDMPASSPVSSEENKDEAVGLVKTKISDLRAPKSPAFKLLGIAASDITLPTSPTALGINLLESISNSNGDFPNNLSLEFAPYWWFDRSELSLEKYYSRTDFGESIFQTTSFSIASTTTKVTDQEQEIDATRLGIGLRFNLISGQPHPTIAKLIEAVRTGDPKKSAEVLQALNLGIEFKLCPSPGIDGKPMTEEDFKKFQKCVMESQKEQYVALGKALGSLNERKVGFQLEFASAVAFDFLDNDFNDSEFSQVGVWLTPSYVQEDGVWSFLGIGRYEYNGAGDKNDHVFDLGGRIIWQPETSSISLSMEYLRRFGDLEDYRLVGVIEYEINDTYSVFASYGKAFEDSFNNKDDLVTLLGINIGLGKKPIVPILDSTQQ